MRSATPETKSATSFSDGWQIANFCPSICGVIAKLGASRAARRLSSLAVGAFAVASLNACSKTQQPVALLREPAGVAQPGFSFVTSPVWPKGHLLEGSDIEARPTSRALVLKKQVRLRYAARPTEVPDVMRSRKEPNPVSSRLVPVLVVSSKDLENETLAQPVQPTGVQQDILAGRQSNGAPVPEHSSPSAASKPGFSSI